MIQKLFLHSFFLFGQIHFALGQVQDGVLDLRSSENFHDEIYLTGDWKFHWGDLLTPAEMQAAHQPDYFHFPATWNGAVSRGREELNHLGMATYQIQLLLPQEYPELAIYVKHVYSAGNLYVNDVLVNFGGEAGTSKITSKPQWVPHIIELPQSQDTITITLQISNFSHDKGGAREPIVLQAKQLLEAHYNELMAYDLLLAGALVMTGLFFSGLFFFGNREIPALSFALFCISFSYRIVGAGDYTLQIIYPGMWWWLSLKLEYLSLFLPPMFLALYTNELFTFRYRVNPFYVFVALSGLFALVSILFPPIVYTKLVEGYLFILLVAILFAAYTYYRAYRQRLNGAKWAMLSSFVVFLIFGYEIFIYLGALVQVEVVSFVGYTLFFFFQSVILFLMFTDALRRAKEEAEKAAKSKSEFLSMMSHEIRTPMNAVIGLTNYLIDDQPKEVHVETLRTLKFSAENLLVIINDILDFSKIEAQKIELDNQPVPIRELIKKLEQIFQPIARAKTLALKVSVSEDVPEVVLCDKTRLSQVLTNLIGNAIKFTNQGKVSVKLSREQQSDGYVWIRFEVADTGIGIDTENQKNIFESFTQANTSITREFGGTGLGLTITKRLLELYGADLQLESKKGAGSKFWFVLNLKVDTVETPVKKAQPANVKVPSMPFKVLLVEDNEVNVIVATKFLHKWGADVSVAKNGQEAVEEVKRNSYSVILMDLQMPVMDGFTASKEIRKLGINVPIIALTASVLMEDRQRIYESGMDDFVMKPFDPTQLQNKLLYYSQ